MHTIILPYFCDDEVGRYERILAHMRRLGLPRVEYEFLLAASPRIDPSDRLLRAASEVGPSRHFACPSQIFGYPEGPTAMFWDCLEHLAANSPGNGFALWLESDMCPIKPDWLDRLDQHWRQCGEVLVMGTVVPQLNRHRRRFPGAKRWGSTTFDHKPWVPHHVNGGACYRCDLVSYLPSDYRNGLFDVRLGELLRDLGGYADTPAIEFSTLQRIADDHANPQRVLVHGYLQEKDSFLSACIDPGSVPVRPRPITLGKKQHPSQPKLDAVFSIKDMLPQVLTVYRPRTGLDHLRAA